MLSSATISFIFAAVFTGAFVGGILGMAGGMILMGALLLVLSVQQAMILQSTAIFFANAGRAILHRKEAHYKSLAFYFGGLLTTISLFALLTFVPEKKTVYFLLGFMPFAGFAVTRWVKMDFTKPEHAYFCGMMTTFFHLTAGVAGPMLDVFFRNAPLTRHQVVATKAWPQTMAPVVKITYFGFIASDLRTATEGVPLWLFLAVIPVAVLGTWTARHALDRITDKQFYMATQVTLFILGFVYLAKGASLM